MKVLISELIGMRVKVTAAGNERYYEAWARELITIWCSQWLWRGGGRGGRSRHRFGGLGGCCEWVGGMM